MGKLLAEAFTYKRRIWKRERDIKHVKFSLKNVVSIG